MKCTDLSKKVRARLRDPVSRLPLTTKVGSHNLIFDLFDMSVMIA